MQSRQEMHIGRNLDPVFYQSRSHSRLVHHCRSESSIRFAGVPTTCAAVESCLKWIVLRLTAVSAEDDQPCKVIGDANTTQNTSCHFRLTFDGQSLFYQPFERRGCLVVTLFRNSIMSMTT